MAKRKPEKIVKMRANWRDAGQIHRMKVVMIFIAVAICISIAAGAILAWIEIKRPFEQEENSPTPSSEAPVSSGQEELPVYDNAFNLVVVNPQMQLKADFTVSLKEMDGFQFDERIIAALERIMRDADKEGHNLQISGGYVSREEQEALFNQTVEILMQEQGYSKVRAEDKAQNTVGRGGYNENQTGMLVRFAVKEETGDFAATQAYQWLVKNSVYYGFILRYPENKVSVTGMEYDPACFRYVGKENALKMREYSMCLEEYAQYVKKQSGK